jgi:hypothetical protein
MICAAVSVVIVTAIVLGVTYGDHPFSSSLGSNLPPKETMDYERALRQCWGAFPNDAARQTFCASMVSTHIPETVPTQPALGAVIKRRLVEYWSLAKELTTCASQTGSVLAKSACVTSALFSPCQQPAGTDWNAIDATCKLAPVMLARWRAVRSCLDFEKGVEQEGGPLTKLETATCVTVALFHPCDSNGDGIIASTCGTVDYLSKCIHGSKVKQARCVKQHLPLIKKALKVAETAKNVANLGEGIQRCWSSFNSGSALDTAKAILCVSMLAKPQGATELQASLTDIGTCTTDPTCSPITSSTCKLKPCISLKTSCGTEGDEKNKCVCAPGKCILDGSSDCVNAPAPKTTVQKGTCIMNTLFKPCQKAATYDWTAASAVCDNSPQILARWEALQVCIAGANTADQEGGALSATQTALCSVAAIFEPCNYDNKVGWTCNVIRTIQKCHKAKNPLTKANCARKIVSELPLGLVGKLI